MFAALLAWAAAGCFSDPINRPPAVSIQGDTTPGRKDLGSYTAQVTDPDNDQRPEKTMWAREPAPCAADTGPASWPPSSDWFQSMPDPVILKFDDKTAATTIDAPFCLWVFVTDSHGAMTADQLEIDPQDRPPTPVITVVAPLSLSPNTPLYPLYSTIELSYGGSSDPDDDREQVLWKWTIQDPQGGQPMQMKCNGNDTCFTADVPGNYQVTLTATDPLGKMATTSPYMIGVNTDQPPCIQIQSVTPTFQAPTPIPPPSDNTLTIKTVFDDGNPTPAGPVGWTHFRWFISKNKAAFVSDDNDRNQLTLTGYGVGDLVKVRVEATDQKPATEGALITCGPDAEICTLPKDPSCFLRLTWSILF